MTVVNKNNAEHYKWGENSDGWHLLNTDDLSIIEESLPPNEKEKRHYHAKSQQFFYVLSGIATIEIDGAVFEIQSASGIAVCATQAHQLMNNGTENLRFLVISQPHSHGDRVNA